MPRDSFPRDKHPEIRHRMISSSSAGIWCSQGRTILLKNTKIHFASSGRLAVPNWPKSKRSNWSRPPPPDNQEPTSLAPHHGLSATQKWLAAVAAAVNVVPKNRVKLEFPAGDIAPIPRPPGPTPKRTEKDRQRVEAVLKVRISSLAKIVSPEMMDSIKHSPYYAHDENKVVLRWHQHWTRGANGQQCFRNLNLFIRNVANEIVYRENSIAADEMVREQGKINDLR